MLLLYDKVVIQLPVVVPHICLLNVQLEHTEAAQYHVFVPLPQLLVTARC